MENIRKEVKKLLQQEHFLTLCTVTPGGFPDARAMINIHNEEMAPHLKPLLESKNLAEIYLTTNTKSAKITQIKKNPKASIYTFNTKTYKGVLLYGKLEEITDRDERDFFWHESWNVYYRGGKDGGDYSMLRFIPETFKYYDGQFNITTGAYK